MVGKGRGIGSVVRVRLLQQGSDARRQRLLASAPLRSVPESSRLRASARSAGLPQPPQRQGIAVSAVCEPDSAAGFELDRSKPAVPE